MADELHAADVALKRALLDLPTNEVKFHSEHPLHAAFVTKEGLTLLLSNDSLGNGTSIASLSGWIAHPMRQCAALDHWVATTSRSLLGASLACVDASPTQGYAVEIRMSMFASTVDSDLLARSVDLIQGCTLAALKDLKRQKGTWAKPIKI